MRTIATTLAAMLAVLVGACAGQRDGDTQGNVVGKPSNADDARPVSAANFDSACKADPPCLWARQLLAERGLLQFITPKIKGEHGAAFEALIDGMARLATLEVHEGPARGSPRYDQLVYLLTSSGTTDYCPDILELGKVKCKGRLDLVNLDVAMRAWVKCAIDECLAYALSGQNGGQQQDACYNFGALFIGDDCC